MDNSRDSLRVQVRMPILVTSREPTHSPYEFRAKTYVIDVGYCGCQIFSPCVFPTDALLELFPFTNSPTGSFEACVIWAKAVPSDSPVSRWKVGLRYITPGNHLNIHPQPHSWVRQLQED